MRCPPVLRTGASVGGGRTNIAQARASFRTSHLPRSCRCSNLVQENAIKLPSRSSMRLRRFIHKVFNRACGKIADGERNRFGLARMRAVGAGLPGGGARWTASTLRNREAHGQLLQAYRADTQKIGYLSREQFVAHWLEVHAAMAQRLPRLRRYVVNLVDCDKFPQLGCDGFSELWFDSIADHDAAFASAQGVKLLADVANFAEGVDPVIVEERRIFWP